MNKFIATGNLTKDPELAYSQAGKPYTRFNLAVNRNFNREETDFFRCVAFGKTAENLVQYQRKGNKLLIEGEVQIDQVEDKYYTNILVNKIEYLSPNTDSQTETPNTESSQDWYPVDDDELPF